MRIKSQEYKVFNLLNVQTFQINFSNRDAAVIEQVFEGVNIFGLLVKSHGK
jgi:hypothetical protein